MNRCPDPFRFRPRPASSPSGSVPVASAWLVLCAFLWLALGGDPLPAQMENEAAPMLRPGANLPTDQDIDRLLREARVALEAGRFRETATMLQHVLDRPGQILTTDDQQSYRPEQREAELILRQMPPAGLEEYCALVDGPSRLLLIEPEDWQREEALTQVLRRYFFSALGDDAAYRLACLALDRGDYWPAKRLLRRIVEEYPAPDVDKAQLWLRLTLVEARTGDVGAARVALENARQAGAETSLAAFWNSVEQDVVRLSLSPSDSSQSDKRWATAFGNWRRQGIYPAVLTEAGDAQEVWLPLWDVKTRLGITYSAQIAREYRSWTQNRLLQHRGEIVKRWSRFLWLPTHQAVMQEGRVYFRGHQELWCVEAATGQVVWRQPDLEVSQSDNTTFYGISSRDGLTPILPSLPEEVMYFGDRLNRGVALAGELVFTIEGQSRGAITGYPPMLTPGRAKFVPPLNALTARWAATGQLAWRREGIDVKPEAADAKDVGKSRARFVGMPVLCAGKLLVPLEQEDNLLLAAIDMESGKERWVIPICQGPQGGGTLWAPVGLSASSDRVYVATGRGVVLALDGATGRIVWASRYERPQSPGAGPMNPMGMMQEFMPAATGWDEDVIFVQSDVLVVLPSDGQVILGLDPDTGRRLFECPRGTARYALGVRGSRLWTASPQQLRCHDISPLAAGDRLKWEIKLEAAVGRGVVTQDSLLVPENDQITCIHPETGRRMRELWVPDERHDPIGNLFVADHSIYVLGLERVRALGESSLQKRQLDRRIAAGDETGRLDRARLLHTLGQFPAMIDDLRQFMRHGNPQDPRREEARALLFESLLETAAQSRGGAMALLEEARPWAQSRAEDARWNLAAAEELLAQGRVLEALRSWSRVAGDDNDLLIPLPGERDSVCLASALASERLQQVLAGASEAVISQWEAASGEALNRLPPGSNAQAYLSMSRCYPGTVNGYLALQTAIDLLRQGGQLERAQQELRQRLGSADDKHHATIHALLAHLAQQAGWNQQAAVQWSALAQKYRDVPVAWQGRWLQASSLAQERLAGLLPPGQSAPPLLQEPGLQALPDVLRWESAGRIAQLLQLEGKELADPEQTSEFTLSHILALVQDSGAPRTRMQIRCLATDSGKVEWYYPLPDFKNDQGMVVRLNQGPPQALPMHSGPMAHVSMLRDGHIVFLVGEKTITGISLLTGKTLWTISRRLPGAASVGGLADTEETESSPASDAATSPTDEVARKLAIGRGLLAQTSLNPQLLEDQVRVFETAGGRLLWSRSLSRQRVQEIGFAGGYLVVMTDEGENALAYDAHTGRLAGTFKLSDRYNEYLTFWNQDGLYYPGISGLVKRRLPDGVIQWITPADPRMLEPLWAGPDHLALVPGIMEGDLPPRLIHRRTGKVVWEMPPGSLQARYTSAAMKQDGKSLVMIGQDNMGLSWLMQMNIATNRKHELKLGSNLLPPMVEALARAGRLLPVMETETSAPAANPARRQGRPVPNNEGDQPPNPGNPRWKLAFVDIETGKTMPWVPVAGTTTHVTHAPVLSGGVMLIMTPTGLAAYGPATEAVAPASSPPSTLPTPPSADPGPTAPATIPVPSESKP